MKYLITLFLLLATLSVSAIELNYNNDGSLILDPQAKNSMDNLLNYRYILVDDLDNNIPRLGSSYRYFVKKRFSLCFDYSLLFSGLGMEYSLSNFFDLSIHIAQEWRFSNADSFTAIGFSIYKVKF